MSSWTRNHWWPQRRNSREPFSHPNSTLDFTKADFEKCLFPKPIEEYVCDDFHGFKTKKAKWKNIWSQKLEQFRRRNVISQHVFNPLTKEKFVKPTHFEKFCQTLLISRNFSLVIIVTAYMYVSRYTSVQCGNYWNLLSLFFDKNFVKVTFLLK